MHVVWYVSDNDEGWNTFIGIFESRAEAETVIQIHADETDDVIEEYVWVEDDEGLVLHARYGYYVSHFLRD